MATKNEPLAMVKADDADLQELQKTAALSRSQAEIQSAITIAKRFPRDETAAYERLMRATDRPSFAEDAAYSFPRGKTTVTGPSVYLAREAARVWGNFRFGLIVLRDDEKSRLIRGWAWDLESNNYIEADDDFAKLIQRKDKETGEPKWVTPDERDLRELTNRRGAILARNCILQLIPKDFIEDALQRAGETLKKGARNDPDGWKKIIRAFSEINVDAGSLIAYLGHPVERCTPDELAKLRQVYKSIVDGNSTWQEYADRPRKADTVEKGVVDETVLMAPSTEPNRGHGNEGMMQNAQPANGKAVQGASEAKVDPETKPKAKKAAKPPTEAAKPLMRGVVNVKSAILVDKPDTSPFVQLTLTNHESPIQVWHGSLHEWALKMVGHDAEVEVSGRSKDGKTYWELERIHRVAEVEFRDNKPYFPKDHPPVEQPTGQELFPKPPESEKW